MSVVDRVQQLIAPLLGDLGLEVYDVEYTGATVRVTVDRPGGVDLDAISLATRLISRELDHADPIPGRYTLEVSSPGLERALRTPAHFRSAVGSTVTVRTRPEVDGDRRARGVLTEADDDGVVLHLEDGTDRRLAHHEIERAKTVFEWGPAARPAHAPTHRKAHAS
jgi:ribosome maturation factor RimP